MDTSSINTTISRIQEIENRLNSLFGADKAADNSSDPSFGDILDNKININEKYFNNNNSNLPNTTELPDVPEIPGAPKGEILNLIDKYSSELTYILIGLGVAFVLYLIIKEFKKKKS